MDFFEHQDLARKKSQKLLFAFIVSVVLIIFLVYGGFAGLFVLLKDHSAFTDSKYNDATQGIAQSTFLPIVETLHDDLPWWDWDLFIVTSLITGLLILLGSSFKAYALSSGGGDAIASALGGQPVNLQTTDPEERQLLNVVEEMAIASGTSVPQVYVLSHENSINAFAAGNEISDAAIGVTYGCMKLLSRDELQGVIAHEFSHILNGDMKFNMRLTCLTFGILFIAQTGIFLIRLPFYFAFSSNNSYSSDDSDRKSGIPPQIILLAFVIGTLITAIGSVGFFFANLIKSAFSRQREFLADAAAVQFTRNPGGIVGALKKIGGLHYGSSIRSSQASEASHFFFANGLSGSFLDLFASHPPLEKRILTIDPQFDGVYPKVKAAIANPPHPASEPLYSSSNASGFSSSLPHSPQQVIRDIGSPSTGHIYYAQALVQAIPNQIQSAAHEPFGSRAVVYCLLLDQDKSMRSSQLNALQQSADPAVFQETQMLYPQIKDLERSLTLPLIDICIPALKLLTSDQFNRFRQNVQILIESDQQISLFEYALQKIVLHHLLPTYEKTKSTRPQYHSLLPLLEDCQILLSSLAYMGNETIETSEHAFHQGYKQLSITGQNLTLLDPSQCNLAHVDQALDRLNQATPMLKKNILFACASAVMADDSLTLQESELLRAIADSLECPIPPFAREIKA